jgi:hypothetical protein
MNEPAELLLLILVLEIFQFSSSLGSLVLNPCRGLGFRAEFCIEE